jgi:hypothetical protein
MSDIGSFVSRFDDSTNILRRFDEALRYFKEPTAQNTPNTERDQIEKLSLVMKPLNDLLTGNLSQTISIDEQGILEILQRRHLNDWQEYQAKITDLTRRISARDTRITKTDFDVLDDVADAIDTQCARLFRRISGRL